MKKHICFCLAVVLLLLSLTACGGSLEVNRNTIYVQKKGNVTGVNVTDSFDKEYYDAAELESYINDRVADYTSSHGEDSVKVEEFSAEGKTAKLTMKYNTCEDYADFNEVVLFAGSMPQAMSAGYDFEDEFLKVEDGVLSGAADKSEVIAASDSKVVILSEKVDVKVDGTILYASAKNTGLSGKDTVSITLPEDAMDGEELKLTYIIYK